MNTPSQSICIEHEYPHPVSKVFAAFSNAQAFEQWFSPTPDITTKALEFNFKIQGSFRLEFAIPDGTCKRLGGEFLAIEENSSLEFSWIWEAPDIHANVETRVGVVFQDQTGGTKVIVHHHQLPPPDGSSRHSGGWVGTLQKLANWLENNK